MELVVDTNVLRTFFWKNSAFRRLSLRQELDLFSPEFALEEINKHSVEVMKKTGLSLQEFKELRSELAIRVAFIPLVEYRSLLSKLDKTLKKLSENEFRQISKDIDFLALALKLKFGSWSNDKFLKKQFEVNVFSTQDIILLLKVEEE